MFDRVNDLQDTLLGDSVDIDVDADEFVDLLAESERPRHVLLSDSVEHETAERTTTVQPDGEHHAYLIVTDDRVLVVLGGDATTVEIEFDLPSISQCRLEDGFLSTTLVVGDGEESVSLSPTHGDAEAVEEYVSVLSEAFTSVEEAIAAAEEMTETLEARIREDGTMGYLRLEIESELSDAQYHATHETLPTDRLVRRVEAAEAEFQRRYAGAWLDRADRELDRAETALDDGEYATFCEAHATAADAMSSLADALSDVEEPPAAIVERIDAVEDRTATLAGAYVEATRDAFETATDADDPGTAATRWLETYRRLGAARDADWEAAEAPTDLPLSELESVAERTVEAVERHATALEEDGADALDADSERARESFQRAAERVRRARSITEEWPELDGEGYEERLADLEERIEVTEWEWGST